MQANWTQQLKNELLGGWKPFELVWLGLFLAAQVWAFVQEPSSWLGVISGISGILCVVFVGKGKISNYFFGLIFAYSYFYVTLQNQFYGEMNTVLYVYLPSQFIGYFLWKQNMQQTGAADGAQGVVAKSLSAKGWALLLLTLVLGSVGFIYILAAVGGQSVQLDGITTVVTFLAQLLMILRYREQWILWILLNVLCIVLWENSLPIRLMFIAYLLNSLYGYYNWSKLQRAS